MIKLICFDLDGVLINNSKQLHYEILNRALQEISPEHVITLEEQSQIYEGLATKTKLQKLTKLRNLPESLHAHIHTKKQEITKEVFSNYNFNVNHHEMLTYIKQQNIKLALCTNTIRETTDIILTKLDIKKYFDFILTNEDVSLSKPMPDIYILARSKAQIKPFQTLIFEDSVHGLEAARLSGAHVQQVENAEQLNIQFVSDIIKIS